jgi:PAS domain-containing protein
MPKPGHSRRSAAGKPPADSVSTNLFDLLPETGCGAALHELIRNPAGVAVDFIIVAANPGYGEILKLDCKAVIGRRASETLPAEDLRLWLGLFAEAMGPDPKPRFLLGPTAGGQSFHGFVRATGQGLIATVFEAATGHRTSGPRIEDGRAELAAIYENAPILMCALDGDRHVLRANRAFTELTGVPESELRGGRACGIFGCLNARVRVRPGLRRLHAASGH